MKEPGNFQNEENSFYSGVNELGDFETGLINYNKSTAKLISKEIISKKTTKILDFGAGKGTLTEIISKDLNVSIDCLEIDMKLKQELSSKKFKVRNPDEDLNNCYNYIYSSNVLEHIKNDEEEIIKLRNYLTFDGKIILYLPANQKLYSDFDFRVGHYRRYNKKELVDLLEKLGFKIEKIHYVDSLGYLAALLFKFKSIFSKNSNISMLNLKLYDRAIFPISILLDKIGAKHLFGKNLFVAAKKL
jgi:hypothetical protein